MVMSHKPSDQGETLAKQGMRGRLEYPGGSVEVQSARGTKTTVRLNMPVLMEKPLAAETQS
jgi:signal transduction histidine kinase